MTVQHQLIQHLADGAFHSGESLGQRLGVSRAAVWKQMRALADIGLDVHAVRGRGYRLSSPLELLDPLAIQQTVAIDFSDSLESCEVVQTVDSTSDHLKRSVLPVQAGRAHACLAEWQQSGRGRRGRTWVSPYGSNLYLSLAWGFDDVPGGLSGLSLAAGVAVIRALRKMDVLDAGLKWPNDILHRGGKLAGILVDIAGETAGPCSVIIGVGMNISMPAHAAADIDQRWSDLSDYQGKISRNRLAAGLLSELLQMLQEFSQHGLSGFLDEWRHYDIIAGQAVNLLIGRETIQGTVCGIDEQGGLQVNSQGTIRSYHAGEISLRLE